MAREYSRIAPEFWTGDTGRLIRAQGVEAQVLALYVLTSPHSKATGLFRLPLAYLSADTGIPIEGASKALGSLSEAGFCHFDFATEHVWVPEMARHQIGDALDPKDKRRPWLLREVQKMEKSPFFYAFCRKYAVVYGVPFVDDLQAPSKPLASPIEAPCKPHRSQEQEIEQEVEQEREPRARAPKSLLALRSERLREGYLARFKRALPNVRPDACCHPMSGGPWLDLARELDDEHVDPLLDAFFADTDTFVAKDRAPGKIRSQRVRLLKARLPAVAPTIDTSDPVAVAEHAFNLAAEAAHASLKAGDDPETTQTLDRAEEAARQALRAAKAKAANGARA